MTTSTPPRTARIAAAAVLALTVGGGIMACTPDPVAKAPDVRVHNAATPRAEAPAGPLRAAAPARLVIPSAGVDASPVLRLGVDSAQELEVPPVDRAEQAGWYTGSVTPGEKGASVLVAHYDTAKGPALMRNVKDMKVGDVIEVGRADGSTAVFRIRETEQVEKKDFPTHKVYGTTDRPELRLITCGGPIEDGHRSANIIFYADLVRAGQAGQDRAG
ncbi:class F sortase [Streptomyces sp. NBC_00083]|uniref:class F sortase n=1 Tax=Streptomyces sp. NBC_00083 TaxID=2975647 RepID=UPI00224E9AE0|nr:class F sortase [Streptomyces sp. NBC_00083]MCX5385653.1 class F sortase [Streptomyces sp. NBC_00083]